MASRDLYPQEILQVVLDKSELAEKDIIALCDEVEDWPTALQLISLSVKQAITKNPECVTYRCRTPLDVWQNPIISILTNI